MSFPAVCPTCSSDDLLVVRLTPADTPMAFNTCRECENTWWESMMTDADTDIDLTTVLDEITS